MPTTFITGAVTTQQTVTAFSELVITQTGIVSTTSGDAITSSGRFTTTHVAGEVYGESHAIFMDDFDFGVGAHVVHVASGGIVASFNATAIELESNGNRIFNDGSISSVFSNAVPVIQFNGNRAILFNNGSIAGYRGINMTASESSATPSQVTNTGTIMTQQYSIRASNQTLELVNAGTIDSSESDAVEILTAHSLRVVNTGVIAAENGDSAISANNADDEVFNSGLIDGSVDLAGGADLYDGRGGTVLGAVRGGSGDDTYIIDDSGTLLVELAGQGTDEVQTEASYALGDNFEILTLLGAENIDGSGNDLANTLTGNDGNNALYGEGGSDTIDGGQGSDTVDGGGGSDTVSGGLGDDRVLGRGGNDLVRGQNGEDLVSGGVGNDTLKGGAGNDILVGGLGRDILEGESGQDVFVYAFTSDSTTGAGSDVILDLAVGEDRLNFAALVDGEFALNLNGAFTGTGPSIRTFETATDTIVLVDADGDGAADMRIILDNTLGLTEAEFIL